MEFKVNLDMTQLDYGKINEEVCKKIEETDIIKEYYIDRKIKEQVNGRIENIIREYFNKYYYTSEGDIKGEGEKDVKNVIKDTIIETVKPKIDEYIKNISEETWNKIIGEIIKEVLIDMISENMKAVIGTYYNRLNDQTFNNITSILRSHGFNL